MVSVPPLKSPTRVEGACVSTSFVYAFYSFEYVWSMQSVDFVTRIQRIEKQWFVGCVCVVCLV
jgi:hypothetical protein